MLVIRRKQMEVLKRVALKVFEDQMLVHLQEYYPVDCQLLGAAQTRLVIRHGVARAVHHGFEARGDVCRYVSLMFVLGSHFDEDPQLPWAAAILADTETHEPALRIQALFDRAVAFLNPVIGAGGEHYRAMLLRARRTSFEALTNGRVDGYAQHARSILARLYPQKYQKLAPDVVDDVIRQGGATADQYGLTTPAGAVLYVVLMFVLGSHFNRDPLFPWAGAVLDDGSLTDPTAKARRLHAEALAHLDRAFAINRLDG